MGKRSLEVQFSRFIPGAFDGACNALNSAGIEIAEARGAGKQFIQVRNTTPTEIKRVLKGYKLKPIIEGFVS